MASDETTPSELVSEFARDVKAGLGSNRKHLHPKYLYDRVGSELFEQICLQPEYYLTRTEAEILRKYAPEIVNICHGRVSVVELGSGSSMKTRILLKNFFQKQKHLCYFPIDISSTLDESVQKLSSEFADLYIQAIGSEYGRGVQEASRLMIAKDCEADSKLVLFLGSSIGNFEPHESRYFLRMLRDRMERIDSLLVGFDLQKEKNILEEAYNDRAGITAKFNLNLLTRINRDLGGEFDPGTFTHRAFYNEEAQRIEMHLVSKIQQQVYVGQIGQRFTFEEGETIHTESSYKYSLEQISALTEDGGFEVKRNFVDEKNWFDLALLSPV